MYPTESLSFPYYLSRYLLIVSRATYNVNAAELATGYVKIQTTIGDL